MSAMKRILEVPLCITEKGRCLHTVAGDAPPVRQLAQEHARTAKFTSCALKLRALAFPSRGRCHLMQRDSGLYPP